MWTKAEIKFLSRLNTAARIQDFLDKVKYNTDDIVRSPRQVIKTKRAHCFDGALFAAAALDYHGFRPLLVALYANGNDDDHVITIYKDRGCLGAVAKSNYVPLRWRDPVYKNLRELVMSYYEGYFTLDGHRTLRAYSRPFNILKVKNIDWRFTEADLDPLGAQIDIPGKIRLLPSFMNEKWLKQNARLADQRSIEAAAIGLDKKGIF